MMPSASEVLEDWRSRGHANAFDGHQILHGQWKAMQRPHQLAAPNLPVPLLRLRKQLRAVLQGDYGVDPRIEFFDVIEIRRHHFDARRLPGADCIAERGGVQHDDAGRPRCCRNRPRERRRRAAERRARGNSGGQTQQRSTIKLGIVRVRRYRRHASSPALGDAIKGRSMIPFSADAHRLAETQNE